MGLRSVCYIVHVHAVGVCDGLARVWVVWFFNLRSGRSEAVLQGFPLIPPCRIVVCIAFSPPHFGNEWVHFLALGPAGIIFLYCITDLFLHNYPVWSLKAGTVFFGFTFELVVAMFLIFTLFSAATSIPA